MLCDSICSQQSYAVCDGGEDGCIVVDGCVDVKTDGCIDDDGCVACCCDLPAACDVCMLYFLLRGSFVARVVCTDKSFVLSYTRCQILAKRRGQTFFRGCAGWCFWLRRSGRPSIQLDEICPFSFHFHSRKRSETARIVKLQGKRTGIVVGRYRHRNSTKAHNQDACPPTTSSWNHSTISSQNY